MATWWQPRAVLRRFVTDLVADELVRQRRQPPPRPLPWRDELQLVEDLGVDSLELLALASALVESLHLHESGIEDYLLARRTLGDWVDVAAAGLAHFSERITFRTSGSTGAPKPCAHALATLRQESAHLATLLPGRRRVLVAVPSHHIYGFLFTVLLPRDLGLPVEAVTDLRASTPAWLARCARPGDLVIGHPDFWLAVARTVPELQPDVVGVTSTAPCPDAVAEALATAGLARLLQVYGTSETGGIGVRDSHRADYALFPWWRFDPARSGGLLRTLPDGGEWPVPMQDALQPGTRRSFRVGPRHDDAVQVGGTNVFPALVRDALRRHPAVADAAVRLMRPDEGTRLKAFIVPHAFAAGRPELLEDLRTWIDRELPTAQRPKAIRLGERLPASATGKAADWDLSD